MSDAQSILDSKQFPEDLKDLSQQDLEQLAEEIRHRLLAVSDSIGGHLASNLGIVEITIALHTLFDSPRDKIVFDVSHQCYVHKMLTGRLNDIFTLKQYGGLSGFAKISESPHDAFGAGHASTSISAALGMAEARDILGDDFHSIAIIGDSSLSGGMAYEAINNIARMKKNFICILNDNEMGISPSVGGMSEYITSIRTNLLYNKMREKAERLMSKIPKIGVPLHRKLDKLVDRLRNTLIETKLGVLFEEFGFKYIGPLDGHNITVVMAALKYAKSYDGPIMVHFITKKGKGLEAAEADPVKYHGTSPKPKADAPAAPKRPNYCDVFGEESRAISRENKNVCMITPAMREGSGLVEYEAEFPDRYFDVGIAEEHAVTFAAGQATVGLRPILAIYSTFLQRGFDQLIHDVCLQKLPVVFALDRAGIVGADGPTHHGVFDIAYQLLIPNLNILAPKDGQELRAMLRWSVEADLPTSIRYPRGSIPATDGDLPQDIELGKAQVMFKSPDLGRYDLTIFALGTMAWDAYHIAQNLVQKGLSVAVINLRFAKPLDEAVILSFAKQSTAVFVMEEGCETGGINSVILQLLTKSLDQMPLFKAFAIPDEFVEHGPVDQLKKDIGLTPPQMEDEIVKTLKKNVLTKS